MKVAFAIRESYLSNRGGDTYQFLKTKEYLEKYKDVEIEIVHSVSELEKLEVDLVHVFNIQTCEFTNAIIEAAKKRNLKVVMSTIFWTREATYVNVCSKITTNFKLVYKLNGLSKVVAYMRHWETYKPYKKSLLGCDMILPNSDTEGMLLVKEHKVKVEQIVVPNCIDIKLKSDSVVENLPENFVLEVARIEPTKNQLGVVMALMNHKEIPLYFIGKQNDCHRKYIQKVKELGEKRGNTYFIEEMPQEELVAYYKAAKVHVLPSFRESPGLVSLEALFYKTNIVVSNERFCPTKYYKFDEYAYICNPYSIDSIKDAIVQAYQNEIIEVEDEYFSFINYKNAAKLTREAYMKVLNINE